MLSNLDMKVEGVLGTSATQVLKVGTRHVDGLLLVGRGSDGTRFQRADRRWVRDCRLASRGTWHPASDACRTRSRRCRPDGPERAARLPPDGETHGRDLQPGLRVLLLPVQGDALPGQPLPDGRGDPRDLHPPADGGPRPRAGGRRRLARRRAHHDGPGLLPPFDRAGTEVRQARSAHPQHDADQRDAARRRVGRVPERARLPGGHLDRRSARDARRLPRRQGRQAHVRPGDRRLGRAQAPRGGLERADDDPRRERRPRT